MGVDAVGMCQVLTSEYRFALVLAPPTVSTLAASVRPFSSESSARSGLTHRSRNLSAIRTDKIHAMVDLDNVIESMDRDRGPSTIASDLSCNLKNRGRTKAIVAVRLRPSLISWPGQFLYFYVEFSALPLTPPGPTFLSRHVAHSTSVILWKSRRFIVSDRAGPPSSPGFDSVVFTCTELCPDSLPRARQPTHDRADR